MERTGIQFVTAADGTSIAYWSVGSGPPIVLIHNFVLSHAELEWEVPSLRSFYEALAEHHQVIRLDPRATGLSGGAFPDTDEQDSEFLDELVGDVEAVVDALGHREFDLVATVTMSAVGIRLATMGRVRRLVLCDPAVNIPEAEQFWTVLRSVEAMAAVDESTAARVTAHMWADGAPPEDHGPLTALIMASDYSQTRPVSWNAAPWLSDVSAPTLIVYAKESEFTSMEQVRHAAATIPEARLVGVDVDGDRGYAPYWVNRESVLRAFGDFLGWGSQEEPIESDFSVIVFTDIVASTEVVDRLGDEAARNAVRSVEDLVAETAEDHSGKVVKHLGDGSLLEFRSASNALDFASKVQAELADGDIGLRVGMAAGEPIHEDGDVHGAVVVVASRIADAAGTGEVFVSDGVRQLVVGKQYDFDDQGEQSIKGFGEAIRVWRLNS